jgi:hypothetical protein
MSEQLGTGADQQVVTLSTKPTIATVPQTSTTADIAAIGTAVNAILSALRNLNLAS